MKKGLTLIEVLVSLVILAIILGAIFSILNLQQTKTTQVSRTTVMQTDAQVAFTLLRWDLMLAGLGYPFNQQDAVQLTGGDALSLRAIGLGFEMDRAHWSYLIRDVSGPEMYVRRWEDPYMNFSMGDTILIVDELRVPFYGDPDILIITNDPQTDTLIVIDSLWFDSIPAARITVGIDINARAGLMVFKRHGELLSMGLTYYLSGDTLYRGTEALLTNVEAMQFRYGIDSDGDGVLDSWFDANNPPFNPSYDRKWALRFTLVVASEGMPGFQYPNSHIDIESDPVYGYDLSAAQLRRKRAILSSLVYPQNLQPED